MIWQVVGKLPIQKVTSKPVTLENVEKLEEDSPGLFPSCAVTRAMGKKATEEPNANKQSEDILVDLSETFLANTDIDTVTESPKEVKID